jgi:hypothetical protein
LEDWLHQTWDNLPEDNLVTFYNYIVIELDDGEILTGKKLQETPSNLMVKTMVSL